MILVSHESPISYLNHSTAYNDYDYCLVHLCDVYEQYQQFFIDSVRKGREVLLDNSIFELGVSFDPDRFAEKIELIKPTFYVVPDVLNDTDGTINSWERFCQAYDGLPGLKIGVVQGNSFEEAVRCYRFMVKHADYIAISFDCSWYPSIVAEAPNLLTAQSHARRAFINGLVTHGIWNADKPHHLLGCSLASEFKHYQTVRGIRSLDTSNPVVAALEGKRYLKNIGLLDKSKVKLADLIDVEYDMDTHDLILENTTEFQNIMRSLN